MHLDNGIFIWWPKIDDIPSLTLQFWQNNSINFDNFSGEIIGSTQIINEFQNIKDIEENLGKLTATTNAYPSSALSMDSNQSMSKDSTTLKNVENGTITEVRVSGNVTGILIPNANQIVVRVIVPVFDGDERIFQDTNLVEWNVVRN